MVVKVVNEHNDHWIAEQIPVQIGGLNVLFDSFTFLRKSSRGC